MKRRVAVLLLSLLINALCVKAQGYSNTWHFGDSASIDFNGPVPVSVGGSVMKSSEGVASISDKYGNLLFYTNGLNVWTRSHVQMPNSFGLMGNTSVTQTIIVKQPGSCELFYIFTLRPNSDTADGLRYSIVDMTQNGGMGDVITKNVLVKKGLTEKITATLHQDSCSVWIMTHEINTDAFLCYELDKDGFDTIPVVSNIGSVHAEGFVGWGAIGEMKFSQDGSKLAQVTYYYDAFNLNFCEVFDFNNLTGIVTNPIFISDTQYVSAYGLEFSPDASKLYLSVSLLNKIYQFDLLAGGAAAIEASAVLVDSAHAYHLGAMQLGPDGKIYVSKRDSTHLGVINNPNALGLACNYNDKGLILSSGTCEYGLPQLIVNTFDCAKPEIIPDTLLCTFDPQIFQL